MRIAAVAAGMRAARRPIGHQLLLLCQLRLDPSVLLQQHLLPPLPPRNARGLQCRRSLVPLVQKPCIAERRRAPAARKACCLLLLLLPLL